MCCLETSFFQCTTTTTRLHISALANQRQVSPLVLLVHVELWDPIGIKKNKNPLITSWEHVFLPVSVYLTGTRKTGCWLTCHYVAMCLRLSCGHRSFLLIFREVWIQRETADRRRALLVDTQRAGSTHQLLHIFLKAYYLRKNERLTWTPFRIARLFCAVILERSADTEHWMRWSHLLRLDLENVSLPAAGQSLILV